MKKNLPTLLFIWFIFLSGCHSEKTIPVIDSTGTSPVDPAADIVPGTPSVIDSTGMPSVDPAADIVPGTPSVIDSTGMPSVDPVADIAPDMPE